MPSAREKVVDVLEARLFAVLLLVLLLSRSLPQRTSEPPQLRRALSLLLTSPSPQDMIILVTGATGKQGSAVITSLLRSSLSPTLHALTRSPTSAASLALASKGVVLIQGSFEDRSSLLAALRGVDAAFLVQADGLKEVEQGLRFVEVAKELGLPFLVYGSAEGAGAYPPALKGKLEIEEAVKASGLPHTILRPVSFFENFQKKEGWERWLYLGIFDAALKGRKMQMVSTADIGELISFTLPFVLLADLGSPLGDSLLRHQSLGEPQGVRWEDDSYCWRRVNYGRGLQDVRQSAGAQSEPSAEVAFEDHPRLLAE